MDVHVPLAITEALRQRGLDVITAQEDGARRFDDPALLDRATELGWQERFEIHSPLDNF